MEDREAVERSPSQNQGASSAEEPEGASPWHHQHPEDSSLLCKSQQSTDLQEVCHLMDWPPLQEEGNLSGDSQPQSGTCHSPAEAAAVVIVAAADFEAEAEGQGPGCYFHSRALLAVERCCWLYHYCFDCSP